MDQNLVSKGEMQEPFDASTPPLARTNAWRFKTVRSNKSANGATRKQRVSLTVNSPSRSISLSTAPSPAIAPWTTDGGASPSMPSNTSIPAKN